jgi:hypothetical protein
MFTGKRQRWTHEENQVLQEIFHEEITDHTKVSSDKIRKAMLRLPNRSEAMVRTKINNMATGKSKK